MRRICLRCGVEFDGDSTAIHCADCIKKIRANGYRLRTCQQCGAVFFGGGRAFYCPDCRAERHRAQHAAYQQRKRAGQVRALGSTDYCVICGRPYIVEGSNQRYCPLCAPGAVRARENAMARSASIAYMPLRAERREAARAPIPCKICGTMFLPRGRRKTCSPECSQELRRALCREWRAAHAEYVAEKNHIWFAENRARRAEYARKKREEAEKNRDKSEDGA